MERQPKAMATLMGRYVEAGIRSLGRTVELERDTPRAAEIAAILDANPDAVQVRWIRRLRDGRESYCTAERAGAGLVCYERLGNASGVAWATRGAGTGDAGSDDCLANAIGYRR